MNTLDQLHADIDTRVNAIRDDHPDWLCRQGCDGCCRRLAEIPRLTKAEWDLLSEGLADLAPEILREIIKDIAALTEHSTRPLICPMLDQSNGACQIYAFRPVACRTYGFFVQRDKGLYCQVIEAGEARGDWVGVMWGNHDAIDRRLSDLGEIRELTEWLAGWEGAGNSLGMGMK
jgi:Fe-S-cluster containining protein